MFFKIKCCSDLTIFISSYAIFHMFYTITQRNLHFKKVSHQLARGNFFIQSYRRHLQCSYLVSHLVSYLVLLFRFRVIINFGFGSQKSHIDSTMLKEVSLGGINYLVTTEQHSLRAQAGVFFFPPTFACCTSVISI